MKLIIALDNLIDEIKLKSLNGLIETKKRKLIKKRIKIIFKIINKK